MYPYVSYAIHSSYTSDPYANLHDHGPYLSIIVNHDGCRVFIHYRRWDFNRQGLFSSDAPRI
jgi:hypothetical protein